MIRSRQPAAADPDAPGGHLARHPRHADGGVRRLALSQPRLRRSSRQLSRQPVRRDDSSCEGFRMPAGRNVASSTEGRRPKASREGTRGGRARRWVYGDLTVVARRGRCRGPGLMGRATTCSAEQSRQARRRVRSRAPRPVDVGAIGGPGRRIDRTRVSSGCRRRRWRPAGLRCKEALLGVMRPRS